MTEVTPGPARVHKRRSRPSFFLIIALSLVVFTIRSPKQGVTANKSSHVSVLHGTSSTEKPLETTIGSEVTSESGTTTSTSSVSPEGNWSSTTSKPIDNEPEGSSDDCYPSAIRQFPRPWMSQKVRLYGGFLFYLIITAYTFLALAIICDEFFVPSLDLMCNVMKISPDVAGATFMAAGSSAPELATALIGVFVAKDDIGVSGVIGSAVFNIMFVISICGLLTPTPLYLNWWPLVRDCFFYMVSILALLGTIADESIEWYESIILLILYGIYCYVMYINEILEAWAHTLPIKFPVHTITEDENSSLVMFNKQPTATTGGTNAGSAATATGISTGDSHPMSDAGYPGTTINLDESVNGMPAENKMGGGNIEGSKKVAPQTESILSQFDPPADQGLKKVLWRFSLPLVYLFYYTVPDCRIETWKSWYIVTFTLAMLWIAVFSYIMVWMITVLGYTVGIPDTVMGLTFVAAGVSVPDALSSLAVIKEGFGDMAVSNAVGSNVFDILICLGLPWFLSTVIVNPGVSVKVFSKGLTYSTFSLLSTVAFLLVATHYNGWKLDKRYGVILMVWYVLFMICASLYELNVFGDFNPPECPISDPNY
ncbi:unnamed protein product [Allacma fusca]|uniref:Sodium/calcium exchanger membrane region domain-containing protein n=1 Tax=Allacma fusca TaxID=39272 RepID=A0A8J2KSF7_9HEXA|nr:unnamed protein product [Allacma fusca]